MWLFRGAQSAVFYYLSCTPCINSSERHKRKREAFRSQKEKAKADAVVTDQPRAFLQPTPFSTNPGWAEEISLGPGPPARKGRHKADRECPGSSSSEDEVSNKTEKGARGERRNWMRYQREDEPLWGQGLKGSSVGISGRARADTNTSNNYYVPRVPPVNDLHPPIVSGPKSRAEVKWMLQPPPSAKVMAGKEKSTTVREPPRRKTLNTLRSEDGEDEPKISEPENGKLSCLLTPSPRRSGVSHLPNPAVRSKKTVIASPATLSDGLYDDTTSSSECDLGIPCEPSPTFRPPSRSFSCDTLRSLSSGWETVTYSMEYRLRFGRNPTECSSIYSRRTKSPKLAASGSTDYRSPPSNGSYLHTPQRSNSKNVQLWHLEINDDGSHDIAVGQLDSIQPARWSIDF